MHIFTLPLAIEDEKSVAENESVVQIAGFKDEKDLDSKEPLNKPADKQETNVISQRYEPTKISFLQRIASLMAMIIWHILLFIGITAGLYAGFHYGFDRKEKEILLDAFSVLYDWRTLVFFLGIYMSYTVKKVSDISSSIPPTDRLANLVSVAIKKKSIQMTVMRYSCTSVAMVFSFLSPMVHKRLTSSERNIKDKLENQSRKVIERIEKKLLNVGSCHFMPLKWTLQVLYEARENGHVEEKLFSSLVSEINHIHAQCDRLASFKHENFSWGLTIGAMIAVFSYFSTGTVRQLWTYLDGEVQHNVFLLSMALSINFIVFIIFMIVMRHAEQIVHPYSDKHDVFELNRILNDKLEVASFVLNIKNDLRSAIQNKKLLP